MTKANEERYALVSILGKPALFTSLRILRDSVPEGIQHYEVRHEDENGMAAAQIARGIMVNHMGTLLMRSELALDARGFLDIEDRDLVFTNSGIRELEAYMLQYPTPGKLLDATKETYEEVLLGYAEQEAALHHWGMLDPNTVPNELQVLYAYEGEDEYGLKLYAPGKTIPVMPFAGSYISTKSTDSLLVTTDGQTSICYREIFSGREGGMPLRDYMKERGFVVDDPGKKKKLGPER